MYTVKINLLDLEHMDYYDNYKYKINANTDKIESVVASIFNSKYNLFDYIYYCSQIYTDKFDSGFIGSLEIKHTFNIKNFYNRFIYSIEKDKFISDTIFSNDLSDLLNSIQKIYTQDDDFNFYSDIINLYNYWKKFQ